MRIISMFNLKSGVDFERYEAWARGRCLPTMRSLVSVLDFNIYRTGDALFSEVDAAFAYVQVIDASSIDGFSLDCEGAAIQDLLAEMREFSDDTSFMTTEALIPS